MTELVKRGEKKGRGPKENNRTQTIQDLVQELCYIRLRLNEFRIKNNLTQLFQVECRWSNIREDMLPAGVTPIAPI